MTQKDYIKFAEMFKGRRTYLDEYKPINSDVRLSEMAKIADFTADIFQSDNPNFDRSRFLIACGLDSSK